MASITSNYGLSKPLGSEAPDISVINDNMDTLDSELVVKTSNDIADATATKSTGWTTVLPVAVGEKVASVFEKFSTMAKNIRWIYKFLGTADISSIGDGTVTNALTTLNTAVGKKVNTADIVNNLTSTSTTQPLSANMGKTLNDAKANASDLATTNATVTSIQTVEEATLYQEYTQQRTTHVAKCQKSSGVPLVHIQVAETYNVDIPGATTILRLPSGYRPSNSVTVPCIMFIGSGSEPRIMPIVIYADGTIKQNVSNTMRALYVDTWIKI